MKKTLTLLKQLVALAPMRRKQSNTGILYDMSRMDDKLQWRVVNVSRKVWEAGNIKVGDHVIILAGQEHAYEFTDGVVITDARHLVAVIEPTPESPGLEDRKGTGSLPSKTLNGEVNQAP